MGETFFFVVRPGFSPGRTFHYTDYTVNVKDYAITANKPITELVNRLIMETCQKGGGTVVITAGKWKSGRIVLKSNVNLHLEEGAEIEFSGNPKDYLPSVYTCLLYTSKGNISRYAEYVWKLPR